MKPIFTLYLLVFFSICAQAQARYSLGPVVRIGAAGLPKVEGDKYQSGQSVNKPGMAWAVGIGQQFWFSNHWSLELEIAYSQQNFSFINRSVHYSTFIGIVTKGHNGMRYKLNSFVLPVGVRHGFSLGGIQFSTYGGVAIGWQQTSKLTEVYSSISEFVRDEDTFKFPDFETSYYDEIEYELNPKADSGLQNTYKFERKMRPRLIGGIGRRIGKNWQFDIDVQMPIGRNSLAFDTNDYDSYSRTTKYFDPTMTLQVSYWIF